MDRSTKTFAFDVEQDSAGSAEPLHMESGVWTLPSTEANPLDYRAAFAVHDAKNIVAALRANVEWVRSQLLANGNTAPVDEALIDVESCCDRLSSLLREALTVTKAAAPKCRPMPTRLSTLVHTVVDPIRRRAAAMNVGVEVVEGVDAVTTLDPALVARLLENLMDNAIRYSRPGGQIVVGYGVQEGEIALTVSDEGPGIPSEQQKEIFEPFQTSAGKDSPNAGLGLAFCKEVAKAHEGDVTAKNGENGGAVFVFRAPHKGPSK